MITIQTLGSSSAGNCYRINDGHTDLLIEAGIRFTDIRKALDFQVSKLSGVLISHNHLDHCKAASELMKAGVDIYASQGTLDAVNLSGHRAHAIEPMKQFTVGTWTILPFDVEHDAEDPLGFLIANKQGEKLLFITDSYYCKYQFPGLTHVMLEINYSLDILDANIESGRVHQGMRSRLLRSHFNLENAKNFLRANDLTRVEEIHLLHLSDTNSNEERFKQEVQALSGKPVYVASRNGS